MSYEFYGVSLEDRFIGGLRRYADCGIEPGHFLRACLENNLREAVGRADPAAMAQLAVIVAYIYNEIPGNCWGSPDAVDAWLSQDWPHLRAPANVPEDI